MIPGATAEKQKHGFRTALGVRQCMCVLLCICVCVCVLCFVCWFFVCMFLCVHGYLFIVGVGVCGFCVYVSGVGGCFHVCLFLFVCAVVCLHVCIILCVCVCGGCCEEGG